MRMLNGGITLARVFYAYHPNESGMVYLLGMGKALRFAFNGRFMREEPLSFEYGSMEEVDLLSILVYNGGKNIELGINFGGVFTKRETSKTVGDLAMILGTLPNNVFTGVRQGDLDGVKYTQYFYAYKKGSVNPNSI